MASRASLARIAQAKAPRVLTPRTLSTAASSSASVAIARAALATTPLARVPRGPALLLGQQRRAASSDDGAQTMVSERRLPQRGDIPRHPQATAAGITGQLFPRALPPPRRRLFTC